MTAPPYTYALYRELLETALEHGWSFIAFDGLDKANRSGKKQCLLRHDCDNDLVAAERMAGIETDCGIKSTYFIMPRSALYNPFALPGRKLIDQILSQGHWLGLHFDELPFANEPPEAIAEQVQREIGWLSQEFGTTVSAVSFHQPSGRVLENRLSIDAINTYDPSLFRDIRYVSDSNLRLEQLDDPLEIFTAADDTFLQFLIHPEWWTEDVMDVSAKWRGMFENNFRLVERNVAEREDAYVTRHDVQFPPRLKPGKY